MLRKPVWLMLMVALSAASLAAAPAEAPAATASALHPAFTLSWGSYGTGDGQFAFPYGVAVDPSSGDVYVSDHGNDRVQKFTSAGTYLTQWGTEGSTSQRE